MPREEALREAGHTLTCQVMREATCYCAPEPPVSRRLTMPTDPTTPTTEAGLQRYSLVIEQDDSAYLERDPAGHWCIADDAEDAVAQSRADERRRLAGLVEAAELRRLRRIAREARNTYVGRNWPTMEDMRHDGIGHGLVEDAVHERFIRRYLDTFQPDYVLSLLDRIAALLSDTEPAP